MSMLKPNFYHASCCNSGPILIRYQIDQRGGVLRLIGTTNPELPCRRRPVHLLYSAINFSLATLALTNVTVPIVV